MSKTILIVDDEDDARSIAVLALQMKTDWTLLQASSGQQALAIAEQQQPDLILLDMMMPDMDGRATLTQLKANPKTQALPVILVTAKVQPLAQTGIAPDSVITVFAKPFRPLALAEQIRAVLSWP
ncbi:MAG: response regulator [Phormidesmis sp.]